MDELITRILAGETELYAELMHKHTKLVRSVCNKYFYNSEESKDIVQETFIKAYFNLSAYKGDYPFVNWLCRIARNLCIDRYRRHKEVLIEDFDGFARDKLIELDNPEQLVMIHELNCNKWIAITENLPKLNKGYKQILDISLYTDCLLQRLLS